MADFERKSAIARLFTRFPIMTNFADRTVWIRDNLDILCGSNSASVDRSTQIPYRGSSDVAILFRAGTIFSRIALLTNSRKAVIDRAGPIRIAAVLSTGPRDTISNTAKALYPPAIAAIVALILLHQVKIVRVREWRSKKRIGLATAEDTSLVQRLRKIKDINRFILTPLVLGRHGWRNETIPVLHGPLPAWKLTCLADYTIRDVLTVIQRSYGRQLIPNFVRTRVVT